jgi:hypothetical protein
MSQPMPEIFCNSLCRNQHCPHNDYAHIDKLWVDLPTTKHAQNWDLTCVSLAYQCEVCGDISSRNDGEPIKFEGSFYHEDCFNKEGGWDRIKSVLDGIEVPPEHLDAFNEGYKGE